MASGSKLVAALAFVAVVYYGFLVVDVITFKVHPNKINQSPSSPASPPLPLPSFSSGYWFLANADLDLPGGWVDSTFQPADWVSPWVDLSFGGSPLVVVPMACSSLLNVPMLLSDGEI
jgi:hypothetical protein